jgi:hypothetical protein
MKTILLTLTALLALHAPAFAEVKYEFAPDFITPPPGKETIGTGHGEIGVDAAGNIYVSVEGQKEGGLQVYSPQGKYLRSLAGTPGTLHGFVIHNDGNEEFIYAAVLGQQKVLKMKLDGTVGLISGAAGKARHYRRQGSRQGKRPCERGDADRSHRDAQ